MQYLGIKYFAIIVKCEALKPLQSLRQRLGNALAESHGFYFITVSVTIDYKSDTESHKNINKTDKVRKLEKRVKRVKREQRSLSRKYENIKKKRGETATKRANINKIFLECKKYMRDYPV